jgi:hypothetical protein
LTQFLVRYETAGKVAEAGGAIEPLPDPATIASVMPITEWQPDAEFKPEA